MTRHYHPDRLDTAIEEYRKIKAEDKLLAPVRDAILVLAGRDASIVVHTMKTWASITFAGARHSLTVRFDDDAQGERFIAFLPEHEFSIEGWLVADAAVVTVGHEPGKNMTAGIELLLLDERP